MKLCFLISVETLNLCAKNYSFECTFSLVLGLPRIQGVVIIYNYCKSWCLTSPRTSKYKYSYLDHRGQRGLVRRKPVFRLDFKFRL